MDSNKNNNKEVEKDLIEADNIESESAIIDKNIEERDMWKDRCYRVSAEFENFKKRTERDRVFWIENSQFGLLQELLVLVDDFDRALKQKNTQNSELFFGIELIYKSLKKILEQNSVIEILDNKKFDPMIHEAITTVANEKFDSGDIIEVLEKGFKFNDKILRVAKVVVAK